MLFSSCSSAWIALPSLPRNEVYGISGPLACGSDLLFPTEEFLKKVQEQIHRVNSTLPSSSEWERHYKAHVTQYISWRHLFPYTSGKLEKIIYAELNQRRPVYLHFSNFKDVGHSVLIDGYCYRDEHFFVHLNQGQGGPTDGWYDFYKGILKPDDGALRVIYTLAPF